LGNLPIYLPCVVYQLLEIFSDSDIYLGVGNKAITFKHLDSFSWRVLYVTSSPKTLSQRRYILVTLLSTWAVCSLGARMISQMQRRILGGRITFLE
jgi:hypothetical protein